MLPPLMDSELSLYYTPYCGYCSYVQRVAEQLGVTLVLRDISADQTCYNDLVAAQHRATVPVLRITSEEGGSEWMPESRDIVEYLVKRFGK